MKRICPIHGLWEKQSKEDRCPKCRTTQQRSYDTTQRDQDRKKFYNSKEWKEVRLIVLSNNPFCVSCGKQADTVDHIIAIKHGGDKLKLSNLQSMCKICHNEKEFKEGNRW